MPFVSRAQQRWGNSPTGRKALGGQKAVDEWNAATPKTGVPEKKGVLRQVAIERGRKRNG